MSANADKIKRAVETKVKHVWKTALKCVEIKFGDKFEGYDQLRAEILRVGNNARRELLELINEEFDLPQENQPPRPYPVF